MFDRWRRLFGGPSGKPSSGSGDPGPSPVAWLSNEIWRSWNDGDAGARDVQEPGKPISDAWPTPVTGNDRRRAARRNVAEGQPPPPAGTLEEHRARLESTPGLGYLSSVHWPVCCERLGTLISESGSLDLELLEREAGSLDRVLTEGHLPPGTSDGERFAREGTWQRTLAKMRAGTHSGDGVALFQCRACGRIYGAYCHP